MSEQPRRDFVIAPGGALRGRLRVPGDKSISHRSVILGGIAEGETEVSGFLAAADTLATARALEALGVGVEGPDAGQRLRIAGRGRAGLAPAPGPLDLGNSGTGMRLLAGVLAGQRFTSVLTGDESLRRRPMRRIAEPLAAMGARVEASEAGTPPLVIHGAAGRLQGIDYRLPVPSAQVKSCLLLAGLHARGVTRISEPAPSRDHTERMLGAFGYPVAREGDAVALAGGGRLTGTAIAVPGDFSSAAFFMVAASIAPGSDLVIEGVGVNPTRTGALDILRMMGAGIVLENEREVGGEPVADVHVHARPLAGIDIPERLVPLAIDEFPALFVAAACAQGVTVLRGASELRVKESDRIAVMAEGLARLGIEAEPRADGMRIRGGAMRGGAVGSAGDHRIAMAFAIAALRAGGTVRVRDCVNVDTSFPGFAATARAAGLAIEVEDGRGG